MSKSLCVGRAHKQHTSKFKAFKTLQIAPIPQKPGRFFLPTITNLMKEVISQGLLICLNVHLLPVDGNSIMEWIDNEPKY